MENAFHPMMTLLILSAGLATYATRIGGYLLVSRMKNIPPRMEAALNAVPAAVLTSLVAPAFFSGGYDTQIAMAVAAVIALRNTGLPMLLGGWAVAMVIRHLVIGG
jgi:uncharacterized membrane protein